MEKTKLLIAGIGASAGGLEALKQVLPSLPDQEGIVYVIVQHMDPKHDSMLTSLLSASTPMKITEVKNGQPLIPNEIFITPPGHDVSLESGILMLHQSHKQFGPKPSVDRFFTSLAEDQGEHSIGIILSGTGSDGALGMRAIKAKGGITIVQKPETSKYDGMPRSAVSTGSVDLVVGPEAIGSELLSIIHSPLLKDGKSIKKPTPDDMAKLMVLLKKHLGHDFSEYKENTIQRRINRRLAVHKLNSLKEYVEFVEKNPSALDGLEKDILISVTEFFRDIDAFKALKESIVKLIESKSTDSPIRVWVPGCSSGEEVYSIAFLFTQILEKRKENFKLQFYATDIDGDVVSMARKGSYPEASLIHINQTMKDRFFYADKGHFQVIKSIREQIVFAKQDIIHDPPFSHMDLIACRNLLIYFNSTLQDRLISMFHYSLDPGGILFLGKSESIGRHKDLFSPVNKKWRIFKRQNTGKTLPASFKNNHFLYTGFDKKKYLQTDRKVASDQEIVDQAVSTLFGPPSVLIDGHMQLLYVKGNCKKYFEIDEGSVGFTIFDLINNDLRAALRTTIGRALRDNSIIISRKNRFPLPDKTIVYVDIHAHTAAQVDIPDGYVLITFIETQIQKPLSDEMDASDDYTDQRIVELEHELAASHERLQTTVEELETSNEELQSLNEELQSANEELQSTNEELETSNEELQATNEELATVNEEMQIRSGELSEANADLENVFKRIGIPLMVLDTEFRIRRYTATSEQLFNIMPGDKGQIITNVGSHVVIPEFKELLDRSLKNGTTITEIVQSTNKYYEMRIYPYYDDKNIINGLLITFYDITIASQREQEFKALAENSPDIVVRFDREQRHLYLNRAIEKVTTLKRNDFIGKTNRELGMPEKLCLFWEKEIEKVFITGEENMFQFEFPGKDGIRWFDARVAPELSPNGRFATVLLISRDITNLKNIQNEYKDSLEEVTSQKELFQAILDRIPVLIIQYDPNVDITIVNKEFENKIGWSTNELNDADFDLMKACYPDPEYRENAHQYMDAATTEWREFKVQTKQGAHLETMWSNVQLKDGTTIGIGIDISDKKAIERLLARKAKLESLGTLAGGIAHDFNNCLTSIIGFSEMALEKIDEGEICRGDLQDVLTAGNRAKELVQQILIFCCNVPNKKEPVRINESAKEVVAMLKATAPSYIDIELVPSNDNPVLMAEGIQIYQILMNLCTNAVQAMTKNGGALRIVIDRVENRNASFEKLYPMPCDLLLKIEISDTGTGIEKAHFDQLFDPYFSTKDKKEGAGLGLAVVHGIVTSLKGEILVDSTLGKGTVFTLYFPLNDESASSETLFSEAKKPNREAVDRGVEHILIVDDEPAIVKMQTLRFTKLGYEITGFDNPNEALLFFKDDPEAVDLIITDMTMPDMTGDRFAKAVKEIKPDIPVILCTGHSDKMIPETISDIAVDAILMKPIEHKKIAKTVRNLLDTNKT